MLTFLRHGETEWNREGRIQGILDIPLSFDGRRAVRAYAKSRKGLEVHIIWTSPLQRAKETALILSEELRRKTPIRIQELESLTERNYGLYQGQRVYGLLAQDVTAATIQEESISGPGVESWCVFQQRVFKALNIIASGPEHALVVVHGGWLKATHALLKTGSAVITPGNLEEYAIERRDLLSHLHSWIAP